jgi:purine-nucleoside phosphorylase
MDETLAKYQQAILEAAAFVHARCSRPCTVGLILGTGLGPLADEIKNPQKIDYADIPHFPRSTVKFHAGKLVLGELAGKDLMVMQGRFHYYEGQSMASITLPIRVMHQLGIRTLIVTNAAGGMVEHLTPGTIALISDHLNLMGDNPLIGPYDEFLGERFVDMSEPYSLRLQALADGVAAKLGFALPRTIYAALSGPSFETRAELRMLRVCGADTVGMSVVPEVLVARQLDLQVLGLTVVTDQAMPDQLISVSHEQVQQVASQAGAKLSKLVKEIIRLL